MDVKGHAAIQARSSIIEFLVGTGRISLVALLVGIFVGVALDDVRLRRHALQESSAAHQYIEAAVHNDPGTMWDTYSPHARYVRGGDRDAYISFMLAGTHPRLGAPNDYRLVARVPLDGGGALLFYQVDNKTDAGLQQTLFPVLLDALGRVDDAGDDGIAFVPPHVSRQAAR